MLFHCLDEAAELNKDEDSDVEGSPAAMAVDAWDREMEVRGIKVGGGRLRPVGEAKTVRVRGGEVLVSDGPVRRDEDQIAGFNVLECADVDEAIEASSRHPTAKIGTSELRPLSQA